jgi:LEA14-like dessication related protein
MAKSTYYKVTVLTLIIIAGILLYLFFPDKKALTDKASEFKPEVIVHSIKMEDDGEKVLKVYCELLIVNKLPLEARVRELQYKLFVDNEELLETLYDKSFVLRKSDTTRIVLPMSIVKSDLRKISDRYQSSSKDSTEYQLHAAFFLDVPVKGYKMFSITQKMVLPIIRPITFKPGKLHLEKLSLSHPEASMKVEVKNENHFRIRVIDMDYALMIGEDLQLTASSKGIKIIPPESEVSLPFDVKVQEIKPLKIAWKALFKDDKTPFRSSLTFKIISKDAMLNNSVLIMSQKGSILDLKESKQIYD